MEKKKQSLLTFLPKFLAGNYPQRPDLCRLSVFYALRYWSDGPGIDSRWCHWGFFPWYPRQNHVA